MKPVARSRKDFRWEGVPVTSYKAEGEPFRDVTRQILFGPEAGVACEVRYFEIEPGGHTALEKHAHPHAVMLLRGEGRVLVGSEVFALEPLDIVRVPPMTWHQFRATGTLPLGFLCIVPADRDRGVHPTEEELRALRRNQAIDAFIRI
jgi:quercetin dioxygenase-like cupin family protein